MQAFSEKPDHKPTTASANLRFGAGNWGLVIFRSGLQVHRSHNKIARQNGFDGLSRAVRDIFPRHSGFGGLSGCSSD